MMEERFVELKTLITKSTVSHTCTGPSCGERVTEAV